jgi:glutathione synthase/RimK-type ligase-like ATP-grasp enzyme
MTLSPPASVVLVVTTTIDLTADRIVERLVQAGTPVFRLNTDRLPYASHLAYSVRPEGITLEEAGRVVHLSELRSFWYRRVRMPSRPPDAEEFANEYVFRESVNALRGALEILGQSLRSLGTPSSLERAELKVLQLHVAANLGFEVPRTLITSTADQIRHFVSNSDGHVVVKPVHSGYFRTSDEEFGIFTQRLNREDLARLEDALPCPIIVQEELPKKYDIRATIVGKSIYAAAIDSQSDPEASVDWRRTVRPDLPHHRHELPADISAKCIAMTNRMNIRFAAIDFVLTPDNRYVFLELNPNGEWLWIEDRLGYPISEDIVRYLADDR